jgi:ABC-type multidrug transport system fused ATPase/permease subunit
MIKKINEILYLFDRKDKKHFLLILFCMSIVGLLEMALVAVIFPFLTIAMQPELIEGTNIAKFISSFISIQDSKKFIIFLGFFVLSLLLLGNIFSIFTNWYTLKESNNLGNKISVKLFKNYLNKPYEFYFNHHSSELAKNVLTEAHRIIVGVLTPGLLALTKGISTFFIVIFLFILQPYMVLTISGIFILLYFVLFRAIKKNLYKKGQDFSVYSALRHKTIVEALSVVKHIQLLGRQDFFLDLFKNYNQKYFEVERDINFVPYFSKYLIETVAFASIILLAIFISAFGGGLIQALPLLGVYVVAGYRLLPAVQQIFNGVSQVHAHWEAVNIIKDDFLLKVKYIPYDSSNMKFEREIKLYVDSFSYNEGPEVLKNIDVSIYKNTMVAFVGATGSGKSTTIDLILGMLSSNSAQLLIDGVLINDTNKRTWQNNIGYVPQDIHLLDDTLWANIAFGVPSESIDKDMVIKAAQMADIHQYIIENLKLGYDSCIGENGIRLSGGQKQRIGIARALYNQPQVLVLDEATSALDSVTESKIMGSVKKISNSKTIILIAHRLSTVELCDKIFVFDDSNLVGKGTYQDLVQTCEQFKRLAKVA